MEWSFDCPETLGDSAQIIDITDDATGLPHSFAQGNIPMYVNEVGHDPGLEQNVLIGDVDDRTAKYFYRSDKQLLKGDTVELLTNYRRAYEPVRERKGYGLKNLTQGLKPASEDDGVRLFVNFEDRQDMQIIIGEASIEKVLLLLQFVEQSICDQLCKLPRASLTSIQWVACRRILWLQSSFCSRVNEETDDASQVEVQQCSDCMARLQSKLKWAVVEREELIDEAIEEMLYEIQHELPMPSDNSVWCPLAVRLINDVCKEIAKRLFCGDRHLADSSNQESLMEALFDLALKASQTVSSTARRPEADTVKLLEFTSGLPKDHDFSGPIQLAMEASRSSNSFFLDHSTFPKGLRAALCKKVAFVDALALAGAETNVEVSKLAIPIDERYVMVRVENVSVTKELSRLGSVPCEVSSLSGQGSGDISSINEWWYLAWQVVYPVHIIASRSLSKSRYSLHSLCEKVGLFPRLAHFAVSRGMQRHDKKMISKMCHPKTASDHRTQSSIEGVTPNEHLYADLQDPPELKLRSYTNSSETPDAPSPLVVEANGTMDVDKSEPVETTEMDSQDKNVETSKRVILEENAPVDRLENDRRQSRAESIREKGSHVSSGSTTADANAENVLMELVETKEADIVQSKVKTTKRTPKMTDLTVRVQCEEASPPPKGQEVLQASLTNSTARNLGNQMLGMDQQHVLKVQQPPGKQATKTTARPSLSSSTLLLPMATTSRAKNASRKPALAQVYSELVAPVKKVVKKVVQVKPKLGEQYLQSLRAVLPSSKVSAIGKRLPVSGKTLPAKKKTNALMQGNNKAGSGAKLVSEGEPTVDLGRPWPPGWIEQHIKRTGGETAGREDKYWLTPETRYRFRSKTEVNRFLDRWEQCGRDEKAALVGFKSK